MLIGGINTCLEYVSILRKPTNDSIELENEILQGVIGAQSQLNIQSTPSFLVNGILIEGNKSIKEFRQILDKILSQ